MFDYLTSPALANVLSDYRFIRGTFVVTITTTTSPHHYGKTSFCLHPGTAKTSPILSMYNLLSADNVLSIDASSANSICLRLPFSLPMEYAAINDALDTVNFAHLSFVNVSPLKRDDGGVVGAPVFNFYVHLEDAQVCSRTNYTISSPGEKSLEAGPVQTIAGVVKSVAAPLAKVPVIGWLASAVADVASGVGTVAAWFGWSRPSAPYTLQHVVHGSKLGNTTVANISDDSTKLALFTETSYPCTLSGVGGTPDPLSWDYLLKRWGLVDQFQFTQASVAGARLATLVVHPSACTLISGSTYATTPLSYFSVFADRWTGSLKYRISISASPYIKGSLLIAYTPNVSALPATQTLLELTSMSQFCVIDIAQECEKVIEVGWQSNRLNKLCGDLFDVNTASANGNGYLQFYVLSPIVASASTGVDLTVSVYVAPGKDFAFIRPTDIAADYTVSCPDARYVGVPSGNQTDEEKTEKVKNPPKQDKPTSDRVPVSGYVASAPPEVYDLLDPNAPVADGCRFGFDVSPALAKHVEVIPSFRALAKRYFRTAVWSNTSTSTSTVANWYINDENEASFRFSLPLYPPWSPGSYSPSAVAGDVLNSWYYAFSPASAIQACFIGVSGAMRYKVVYEHGKFSHESTATSLYCDTVLTIHSASPSNNSNETYVFGTGSVPALNQGFYGVTESNTTAATRASRMSSIFGPIGSGAVTNFSNSTERYNVCSAEIPYSSAYRYQYPVYTGDVGEADGFNILVRSRHPSAETVANSTSTNTALFNLNVISTLGEDFSAFFFMGTPRLTVGSSGFNASMGPLAPA